MNQLTKEHIKALVKESLTCGDCRGLTRNILLPSATNTCAQQGHAPDSKACKHFRTNVYDIKQAMEENGDKLVAVFNLFSGMEDKDLRLLAGMLLAEHKTRRLGFKMGQPVFVQTNGRHGRLYLNNFTACRVLDADENEVRLISENGTMVLTYPIDSKAVFTKKEFAPMIKEMRAKQQFEDPEKRIMPTHELAPKEEVSFMAPTGLDGMSVPKLDEVVKKGKKRIKTTQTLVDIVGLIEGGKIEGTFSDDDESHDLEEDKYESYREIDDEEAAKKKKKKKKAKAKGKLKAKKIKTNKDGSVNLEDLM